MVMVSMKNIFLFLGSNVDWQRICRESSKVCIFAINWTVHI